ncbi:MAG: glycosyltransferase family 39 protein [Planctomycetota bacterium]
MQESATNSTACETGVCAIPTGPGKTIVSFWDIIVLGGIFAAMVYGIGSYGLYEPHEGHFAGVGREMVLNNDWVTPRLNGAPYLNKPPVFYWAIALSYTLFGISEWAARFPQALIGWLGVVLAWKWARELWGAQAGRAAACILGVSAGWYLFSHQLLIDELLSVLYLASLYYLWKALKDPDCARGWAAFYVTIGISVLSKGLIGLGLPFAVLGAYSWLRKNGALRKCRPLLGLLIIALIVAPWLVMIEVRNPGFLKYAMINEHWNRIFDKRWPPDYSASKTNPTTFVLIACVWIAPWALFLPQIVSFSVKKASHWSGDDRHVTDAVAILALGALLPTLLFVPIPARLIYYSLPTLPAFAVLAGGWWAAMSGQPYRRGRKLAAVTAFLSGVAIAVVGQRVAPMLNTLSDLKVAPETLEFMPGFALYIGIGLALCGVLLWFEKTIAALMALCLMIGIGEASNTAGFAAFDRVRSSKRMIATLGPIMGPDAVWVSEGSLEIGAAGGTAFYLGVNAKGPRFVYVMNSDSPYRRPPSFPGKPPIYLTDDAQLDAMWKVNGPVVYVTDLMRTNGRKDDPITLPPQPFTEIFVPGCGHRRVFLNSAAAKLMNKK